MVRRFVEFAKKMVLEHVPTLDPKEVMNFEEWLEHSSYSGNRKDQLRLERERIISGKMKWCNSKAFIKYEGYDKADKPPRIINSPSDAVKTILGPYQASMDHAMFTKLQRWFVKGTDPRTWVEKQEQAFGTMKVINTDFSSFECHHRGAMAYIVWFWQMHMLRDVFAAHASGKRAHKNFINKLIRGSNVNYMGKIKVKIDETLMSGVAWTSSSNGLLNWLINSFLCLNHGNETDGIDDLVRESHSFRGMFEGDDGVFEDRGQTDDEAECLGVMLVMKRYDNYEQADFCSMTFVRGEPAMAYDWRRAVRNLCLIPMQYIDSNDSKLKSLLRAKALSYSYLYHDSPIVGELAKKVLDLTRGYCCDGVLGVLEVHKRQFIAKALSERLYHHVPNPSPAMRVAYAAKFGISPAEQLLMERQIRNSGEEIKIDMLHWWKPEHLELALNYLSASREPIKIQPFQRELFFQDSKKKALGSASDIIRQFAAEGRRGKSRKRVKELDKQLDSVHHAIPFSYCN